MTVASEPLPPRRPVGRAIHQLAIVLAIAIPAVVIMPRIADRPVTSTQSGRSGAATSTQAARLLLTATLPLEGRTTAVLATPDAVWTLSADAVQRIDPETNQIVATFPRAAEAGFGGGFAYDGSSLWIEEESVTWSTINGMFRLDPSTGARTGHWDYGSFLPSASLYAEGYIWVGTANLDEPGIFRIDTGADGVRHRIPVEGAVQRLTSYGSEIWGLSFTGEGTTELFVIDAATLQSRVVTSVNAMDLGVGPTGVWISGWNDSFSGIYRLDPATGSVLQTVEVAGASAVALEGDTLWVLSENRVTRVDATSGTITGSIDLDGGTDLTVRDGTVWVVDYGNGVTTPTGRLLRIDT